MVAHFWYRELAKNPAQKELADRVVAALPGKQFEFFLQRLQNPSGIQDALVAFEGDEVKGIAAVYNEREPADENKYLGLEFLLDVQREPLGIFTPVEIGLVSALVEKTYRRPDYKGVIIPLQRVSYPQSADVRQYTKVGQLVMAVDGVKLNLPYHVDYHVELSGGKLKVSFDRPEASTMGSGRLSVRHAIEYVAGFLGLRGH